MLVVMGCGAAADGAMVRPERHHKVEHWFHVSTSWSGLVLVVSG